MPRKKPTQALAKVPKAEPPAEDQIHQVFTWIIEGNSSHNIDEAIRTKLEGVANPAALIEAAMNRIAESADSPPDIVKGWAIEASRNIYQKALDVGDHQTALRALKQIVDLSER